jgi:hypothetical protein
MDDGGTTTALIVVGIVLVGFLIYMLVKNSGDGDVSGEDRGPSARRCSSEWWPRARGPDPVVVAGLASLATPARRTTSPRAQSRQLMNRAR